MFFLQLWANMMSDVRKAREVSQSNCLYAWTFQVEILRQFKLIIAVTAIAFPILGGFSSLFTNVNSCQFSAIELVINVNIVTEYNASSKTCVSFTRRSIGWGFNFSFHHSINHDNHGKSGKNTVCFVCRTEETALIIHFDCFEWNMHVQKAASFDIKSLEVQRLYRFLNRFIFSGNIATEKEYLFCMRCFLMNCKLLMNGSTENMRHLRTSKYWEKKTTCNYRYLQSNRFYCNLYVTNHVEY